MKRDLDAALVPAAIGSSLASPPVLACVFAVVVILAVYSSTAASIVAIWIRSETFAHCFVVIPFVLWLGWRERHALARAELRPWWPGVLVVIAAGALGFLGAAAGATVVRQFALVFMLQAAIVTIVGLRAARILAFPLAFLLFAVPAGEFLVPTLIDKTADFTIAALRLTGIPVYRQGNQFVIPSGAWSVVEACSGIRYIIASLMVGTIYAAIAYRSALRKAVFIAASIVVPVIANWLRAYIIVMLGHLSDNRLAAGVDHLIYGWLFFGIVIAALFWIGSKWQEDAPKQLPNEAAPSVAVRSAPMLRFVLAACIVAIASGTWQPLAAAIDRPVTASPPLLPRIEGAAGWEPSSSSASTWRPLYTGAAARIEQRFSKDGREAIVFVEYYRAQSKGRELITTGNTLVAPESREWKMIASGSDVVDWNGVMTSVHRGEIAGRNARLLEYDAFWVAGRLTTNPFVGKALQAWSKLSGNGDDAALIVIATPTGIEGRDDEAVVALQNFVTAMTPAVERALEAARRSGR